MEFELTSGILGAVMKIDQLLKVIGISSSIGISLLLMTRKLVH
ncbi:hypothetical protein [Candidatus Nitrotoga sp. 1052]|nr:hypothetical protein [Candidatus Nitrotoga sp. 1052]